MDRQRRNASIENNPAPPLSSPQSVDTDAVLGALAHLAAAAPAGGDAVAAADVAGSWDLVYAAPAPLKAWRYIPVPETW